MNFYLEGAQSGMALSIRASQQLTSNVNLNAGWALVQAACCAVCQPLGIHPGLQVTMYTLCIISP